MQGPNPPSKLTSSILNQVKKIKHKTSRLCLLFFLMLLFSKKHVTPTFQHNFVSLFNGTLACRFSYSTRLPRVGASLRKLSRESPEETHNLWVQDFFQNKMKCHAISGKHQVFSSMNHLVDRLFLGWQIFGWSGKFGLKISKSYKLQVTYPFNLNP